MGNRIWQKATIESDNQKEMNKMDKRLFVPASLLLALGGSDMAAAAETSADPGKPNIIIILADDLGWGDLGYHGSRIKTPNIDKLSESGIQLTRFYTAPICSPTRAGLLTGMYPSRFGIRENVIPPWRDYGLDPSNLLIPEFLEKHGYKNRAVIGKWHLGHSRPEYYPMNQGFTHFYGHLNGAIDYFTHERDGELDWHNDFAPCYDKGYATDLLAGESVRCIKEYAKEGPFFLYVAFNAPHTPLQAKTEDLELYGYDASQPVFSKKKGGEVTGQGNTRWQTYAAMVTCMDRGIGNILQALRDMNIEDNTLVLFMSDNGADVGSGGGSSGPLNGHKFLEYDGGVLSPAILRWPARFKEPSQISQLTGFVDVFPTICDILEPDSSSPAPFDGISILKVLDGCKKNIERTFYLGCGALVEGEWKIIRKGQNPRMKLNNDVLFNMISDPYETTDVSGQNKDLMIRLTKKTVALDALKPARELPPYEQGRDGFVPPKEWNLFPGK